MIKFLKTIRFDPSDLQVFEQAAEQNEWAVPGGFMFADAKESDLKGKRKQAFSNAFLSTKGFGFSTFASVAEISSEELNSVVNGLSQYASDTMGAPSNGEAIGFAEGEVSYTSEMCEGVPINSIFAVSRYFDDDEEIREEFRIVQAPQENQHARVWDIVEE